MPRTAPEPARATVTDLCMLAALTLGGAALRAWHLGAASLWYDEALTWQMVQGGWREIIALNATSNSAPPLFALLLGAVTGPAASEAVLRVPSLIAGVASIPLMYLLAREFLVPRYALLAALLTALAPTQIGYAQQVREYSLAFLAAAALLLCYSRFIRSPGRSNALLLAVAAGLGIGIQYGIGLLLAGLNLVYFAALWREPELRRTFPLWLAAQLPAVGVAAALAVTTLPGQLAWAARGKSGYLLNRYWDGTGPGLKSLLTGDGADIVHFAYPGRVMLALALGGAILCLVRPGLRRAAAFLIVPGALTGIAALAAVYPFGGIRQDIFLLPMIYVAAAIAFGAAAQGLRPHLPRPALAGCALLAIGALAYRGLTLNAALRGFGGIEPLRPVVAALQERLRPGERIYVYSGAVPAFGYYWRSRPEPWQPGALHWWGLDETQADAQMTTVHGELEKLMADGSPFWIVASHLSDAHRDQLLEPVRARRAVELASGAYGSWLYYVAADNDG